MTIDYAQLQAGQRISEERLTLDAEAVGRYAEAVGDASSPAAKDGTPLVNPMAVGALALSAVINALKIPGGTIHAGQELDFGRALPIGAELTCTAIVAQNSVRREWRFLVVSLTAADDEGNAVMQGKSTIMLPTQAS